MKPVGKQKIIVSVMLNQKDGYTINTESGLKTLYTGSDFSWDGKVRRPVLARVIGVSADVLDISPGEFVLCNHNTFCDEIHNGYMQGYLGVKTENDESVFQISYDQVELKLNDKGIAVPIKNAIIAERIYMPPVSKIIIDPNPKTYLTRFRAVLVGAECYDIYSGSIIECYKHSDYEIIYYFAGNRKSVLKIRYDDVLGVSPNKKEYEYKPEALDINY